MKITIILLACFFLSVLSLPAFCQNRPRRLIPVFVGDKFQPDRNFDLNEYLSGSFTMLKGEGDFEVVIEFDPWATDMLRHRLWHQSQQIKELPGGGSHIKMRLSALEEIERWVLSWGTHATVIKPDSLAHRVGRIATKLANRYPAPESEK